MLKSRIYYRYLKSSKNNKGYLPPLVEIAENMKPTFEKVKDLIFGMCDLEESTRPGFDRVKFNLE